MGMILQAVLVLQTAMPRTKSAIVDHSCQSEREQEPDLTNIYWSWGTNFDWTNGPMNTFGYDQYCCDILLTFLV